jgi:hypothetical protein
MKTFKVIGATALLALSLSVPAYAETDPGDGHGPGRTTSEPSDFGTVSEYSASTSASDSVDDGGLLTVADILWALSSIY